MKLLTLFLLTLALHVHAQLVNGELRNGELRNAAPVVAVAVGSSFSDNFNRTDADSLGANWAEITSSSFDIDIVSNAANAPNTSSLDEKAAIYTGTALATAEQYIKITFGANPINSRPGVIFRATDGSSAYYEVRFDDANDQIQWNHLASGGGSETLIGFTLYTVTFPFTVGLTISGTGNSTVVRVWDAPTANAPTSATSWDGGAADFSLGDNPGSPVDAGAYVGIGGLGASGALIWDDLFGGDIP